ncbi:MAG: single-stranded DNA-binding protein [Chloroflexi bacterium]|nr:single-stranded DNA-binding protein [Chloroflexota bacterium]
MVEIVNRVILFCNLGRGPEVRHTKDGMPIVKLSIAASEQRQDSTRGNRRGRVGGQIIRT